MMWLYKQGDYKIKFDRKIVVVNANTEKVKMSAMK